MDLLAAGPEPQPRSARLLCYGKDGAPFCAVLLNLPLWQPNAASDLESPSDLQAAPGQVEERCRLLLLWDVTAKPQRIAHYEIGKQIGHGAFGVVHLGRNTGTGRFRSPWSPLTLTHHRHHHPHHQHSGWCVTSRLAIMLLQVSWWRSR